MEKGNENYYFDEVEHKYYIDDVEYPSVTDICDPISISKFSQIENKWLIEVARDRGTRIHEYCEQYCLFGELDFDEVDDDCLPYMYAFERWYKDYKPKVLFTEKKMFSEKLGFCGTCDLICEIDGKTILVDYKSTSSLDKKYLSVQFEGYYRLLEEYGIHIDECVPLHLKNTQKYSFNEVERDVEWFDALLLHSNKMRKKKSYFEFNVKELKNENNKPNKYSY